MLSSLEKTMRVIQDSPAREAQQIKEALMTFRGPGTVSKREALQAAAKIILARSSGRRKRESDRRTDAARRVLVGARLPRATAAAYRAAAVGKGLSLYAWVTQALEERYRAGW